MCKPTMGMSKNNDAWLHDKVQRTYNRIFLAKWLYIVAVSTVTWIILLCLKCNQQMSID